MASDPFSFFEREFNSKDLVVKRKAVEHATVIAKVLGEDDTRGYLIPFLHGLLLLPLFPPLFQALEGP